MSTTSNPVPVGKENSILTVLSVSGIKKAGHAIVACPHTASSPEDVLYK